MKKVVVLFILFVASVNACYSCSCVMGKVDMPLYIQTEIIFTGKIIKVLNNKSLAENQITFEIKQGLKGLPAGKRIFDVNTPDYGGMCGISGKVGEDWLIWAYTNSGKVYTNICTHSSLISKAREDLKIIQSFKEKEHHNWYLNGRLVANGKLVNNIPVDSWRFLKMVKQIVREVFQKERKMGIGLNILQQLINILKVHLLTT